MKKTIWVCIAALAALVLVATQLTFFVVPPIGALPEGKTVLIARLNQTEFIDSPDGICERMQGGVSLLCRGIVIAAVMNKATVLLRLPYSSVLYSISTGGKTYDR
jgi:hypothetical protein